MDKIKLTKLRKLLRLAVDQSNPNESKLAAQKALELVGNDDKRDFVEVTDLPYGYSVITGVYLRQTQKAVLMDFLNLSEPIWLPLSQLTPESRSVITEISTGDEIELAVSDWILHKHGLKP